MLRIFVPEKLERKVREGDSAVGYSSCNSSNISHMPLMYAINERPVLWGPVRHPSRIMILQQRHVMSPSAVLGYPSRASGGIMERRCQAGFCHVPYDTVFGH